MKLFLFISFLTFANFSFSAEQCSALFLQQRNFTVSEVLSDPIFGDTIEARSKFYIDQVRSSMSKEEIDQLKFKSTLSWKAIEWVRSIVMNLGQFSGSEQLRIKTEEIAEMRPVSNKIKSGHIKNAVDDIKYDFANYEINYLAAKDLEAHIQELKADLKNIPKENLRAYKRKIFYKEMSLRRTQYYLGLKYFKYEAIKNALDEMQNSNGPNHAGYAKQALELMRGISISVLTSRSIEYKTPELIDIERYLVASSMSQSGKITRATFEESWYIFKIITLSKPILDLIQKVSKVTGAVWNRPLSQQLRDLYLEDIETLYSYNANIHEQYKALKRLNATTAMPKPDTDSSKLNSSPTTESAKGILAKAKESIADIEVYKKLTGFFDLFKPSLPDELMVTFARVPENQEMWLALVAHAKTLAETNAFDKRFYERMLAAEKEAIRLGEFPLYRDQAGAARLMTLGTGLFGVYISATTTLQSNPQVVDFFLNHATNLYLTLYQIIQYMAS